jgi:putative flippase GtrA
MALTRQNLYFSVVLSVVDSFLPVRFLKFGLVGGIGIVVNLIGMALIIHFVGWRDWRASALATFLASMNNFILNNTWTFRDRMLIGIALLRGYLIYAVISSGSLATTTGVYTGLNKIHYVFCQPFVLQSFPIHLLFFQFAAILFGTYFNYILNKKLIWKV